MRPQRKLVTVKIVTSVRRLEGSQVDVLTIDNGWTVVAPPRDFKCGDFVVYFELDSFIPAARVLLGMIPSSFSKFRGQKGLHVKSLMIGGHLSQGVAYPLHKVPEIMAELDTLENKFTTDEALEKLMEMDFADKLGVKKWEVFTTIKGTALGLAPKFFPQPACDRAQGIPSLFTPAYLDMDYQITEKLDGMSMTIYRVDTASKWYKTLPKMKSASAAETAHWRIGITTQAADVDERYGGLHWDVAKRLNLHQQIHHIGKNIAIQGELVGHSIKHNGAGFPPGEHTFFAFDIFDIDKQKHLNPREVVRICESLGIAHVPVLGYSKLRDFSTELHDLISKARGVGINGVDREGLVFKSDSGFSFKVISTSWLFEHGE